MRLRCYAMSSKVAKNGAEEGTRTPTPLRVHGPEPCASANSATMASGLCCSGDHESPYQEDLHFYSTDAKPPVKPGCDATLSQLRTHRDLRVQHLRHRTALLRCFSIFLKGRRVCARHFADDIDMARRDRPSRIQLVEGERHGRRNALR